MIAPRRLSVARAAVVATQLGGTVCFAWLCACAPPIAATPYPAGAPRAGQPVVAVVETEEAPHSARFRNRVISLEPFVSGFPYADFDVDLRHGVMFYLDKRSTYTLRRLELGKLEAPALDLSEGRVVSTIDWSQRGLRDVEFEASRNRTWLLADTGNDERWNLWTLSGAEGAELERVTNTDYIYGFGLSEDESQLAYIGRKGERAPFTTCVFLRDLASGSERQLVCDEPTLRFTWGTVQFTPDNRELYFVAQVDGDRARGQIVRLDVTSASARPRLVTNAKTPRFSPNVLRGWYGDQLLYVADDDGYRNLYAYSRKTRRARQVTHFVDDVSDAKLVDGGVFVAHGTPRGTTIELVDVATGESRSRGAVPGSVSILDAHGANVLWSQEAPDMVFEAVLSESRVVNDAVELRNRKLITLDPGLQSQIVQCRAEAVEIPTFDIDNTTGNPRTLHAFVLHPMEPAAPADTLVMIRSFYGGANSYTRHDHVLCAAGITIVSPAVRGSRGFGREFYALNDKDLGGDEIVDLFHVARWSENRFGVDSARVGLYGRSHGGYATMRALTFPPQTNGRNETYPFGFGLAEAGFSDIKAFHDASNIPDWVVLEAGDPATPEGAARLAERSPINHVDRLAAPLFLLHGSSDWRVPAQGSRAFADAAKAAGKDVVYVEVEGQGHHIEGLDRIAAAYQARFDFLMRVSPSLTDSSQ